MLFWALYCNYFVLLHSYDARSRPMVLHAYVNKIFYRQYSMFKHIKWIACDPSSAEIINNTIRLIPVLLLAPYCIEGGHTSLWSNQFSILIHKYFCFSRLMLWIMFNSNLINYVMCPLLTHCIYVVYEGSCISSISEC